MGPFDYTGSTALVTGASRGIGAALVRELAAREIGGLVLTARSEGDLKALAEEIAAAHPGTRVEIIAADLSDPVAPEQIKAETDWRGLSIDLLVNNAGFGTAGYFEEQDPQREQAEIAVNVSSLVLLTRLYLPEMRRRKRGGVVNVGSTAGFQPVPYMATYGATKAFVLSFSEALWVENRDRKGDVRVVCLCPGGTETNFGEHIHRGKFEGTPQSTPAEVAKAGLGALDRGAPFVVVGAANYVGTLGARFLPRAAVAKIAGSLFRPEDASGKADGNGRLARNLALGAAGVAAAVGVALAVRRRG